jgi:hypothetical protein
MIWESSEANESSETDEFSEADKFSEADASCRSAFPTMPE